MKVDIKIGVKTSSVWRKLMANVNKVKSDPHVKVGILKDKAGTYENGTSLLDLAMIHEFGAPRAGIPARPFLFGTLNENRDELDKMISGLAKKVITDGMPVGRALGQLGAWATAQIKNNIREGIDPPNAESTIARKGSSTPLVDTGRLINAITWEVVE